MAEIYGTLGPKCASEEILVSMIQNGMTGIRLNLSHTTLREAAGQLAMLHDAERKTGIRMKLLIDMQGPELRSGKLQEELILAEGAVCTLQSEAFADKGMIPVPDVVLNALKNGQELLLDDGKILLRVQEVNDDHSAVAEIVRGGVLKSRKSIAVPGADIYPPALTKEDRINLQDAVKNGVYGVMQPFVRSREDLQEVRAALDAAGAKDIRIFAKIENRYGVENIRDFIDFADEIIIARGDLGNAMPLWELPRVQKELSAICRDRNKPFMVVTQMLASMEKSAVPTRAEVSDIFNAVLDGAHSVMITGETAAGDHPVEAISYLSRTAQEAETFAVLNSGR